MFKKQFYEKASLEYINIGKYIAQDNLYYAGEVLNKIDNIIDLLLMFPLLGKDIDGVHRQIIEPDYKFKIIYKVEGNIIYIVSIFREQNNWK